MLDFSANSAGKYRFFLHYKVIDAK